MLDITKYKTINHFVHIGKNVRRPLDLKKGQNVYIYEDKINAQLILTSYKLKRSIYHSILLFNNIEKFVEFGNVLSENGINMFCNCFYNIKDKYRMSMIFEIQEMKSPEQWGENSILNTFKNVALKHGIIIQELFWCHDAEIETAKNIFLPLITLSDRDDNIPKKVIITTNWTFYYNLSIGFKENAQLKEADEYKCVQIANIEAGVITFTFHNENVKKINLKYLNLPGSLVRIINIFKALDMKIIASNTQVISSTLGGSAESLYAIEFPFELNKKFKDLKSKKLNEEILSLIKDTDSNLAKNDSSHEKTVNLHKAYLNTIGVERKFFIIDAHSF